MQIIRLLSKSVLSMIALFIVFSVGLHPSSVEAFGVSGNATLLTRKINASAKSSNLAKQTYSSSLKIKNNLPDQTTKKLTNQEQPQNLLSFNISKIGLYNVALVKSSVTNLDDLDQKMLKNPILDTLTSEPCLPKSSTYIMGHSEPATKSSGNQPAVRIFSDLNKLNANDKVEMTNSQGAKCVYNIIGSEIVSTGSDNGVSAETFNNLYFPEIKDNSILKIQTCVKGSATKRLIYTAVME